MLILDEEVAQFTSDQSAAQAVSSVYWTVQEILTPSILALMQRMLLFIVKVCCIYTNHLVEEFFSSKDDYSGFHHCFNIFNQFSTCFAYSIKCL